MIVDYPFPDMAVDVRCKKKTLIISTADLNAIGLRTYPDLKLY